jgi:hypothetical protein
MTDKMNENFSASQSESKLINGAVGKPRTDSESIFSTIFFLQHFISSGIPSSNVDFKQTIS